MMKLVNLVLILATMIGKLAFAVEGNEHGNAGDFLRFITEEGRTYALQLTRQLKPCAIPSTVPGEVRDWILTHQNEFMLDLQATSFVWTIDARQSCAFTSPVQKADIILSYEACRPTLKKKEDAGRLLLHEITHHFGITDESFADWVSYAIYEARNGQACQGEPGDDIFSPSICSDTPMTAADASGLLDLPNQFQKKLGEFNAYSRTRKCFDVGGCTSWNSTTPTIYFEGFQGERENSDHHAIAKFPANPTHGEINIALASNRPFMTISTPVMDLSAWWSTQGPETYSMEYKYDLNLTQEIQGLDIQRTSVQAQCLQYRMSGPYSQGGFHGCNAYYGPIPDRVAGLIDDSGNNSFHGRLTNHCLWLGQRGVRTNSSNGNSYREETEIVFFGKF